MIKKDYRKWAKRLKKYWKMRETELMKFLAKEDKIEKLMRKETGEQLEFFYNDDGLVIGIGHADWGRRDSKRKDYFPLIHDGDLRHDIVVKMPPKKKRTIELEIKSIKKAEPKIVKSDME